MNTLHFTADRGGIEQRMQAIASRLEAAAAKSGSNAGLRDVSTILRNAASTLGSGKPVTALSANENRGGRQLYEAY